MARLNEAPQPAPESIDALKRRFVRQNREIAKANATQAVRIRNLEIEISRLLGENVSLREQIIKLHYEVESNKNQLGSSLVESFRTKLEIKLKEAKDLVEELGQAQQDAKKKSQEKRKSLTTTTPPRRSPNQRIWRNTQTLSDLMGEGDGRLPPILEDKYFPRQTLNSDELQKISGDPTNLTDSPDLGPPPIAHFEEGDPIKLDTRNNRRASKDSFLITDSSSSANLETRRRRRESSHSKEGLSNVLDAESAKHVVTVQPFGDPSQIIKTGAKRKLNVRDEDEQLVREAGKDGVQIERKGVSIPIAEKTSKTATSKPSERPSSRTDRIRDAPRETVPSVSSTGRRALGSKSTNIDPQSPAKAKLVTVNVKPISSRETLVQKTREKEQQRERPGAKTLMEPAKPPGHIVKTKEPDVLTPHEPETPAPPSLDLFSPTSTEPSARQEGRGDTPPPPDLGPDTGTGSYGRASRRSRGSVSYVEPSLRDKMRRPTKELVDAVVVGAEEQRAKQARAIMRMDSSNQSAALAGIKVEKIDGAEQPLPNWRKVVPVGEESLAQKERLKAETTSPLGKKEAVVVSSAHHLPSSVVITDRKRRASKMMTSREEDGNDNDNDNESGPAKSRTSGGARSTVAALAKSKRGQQQQQQRQQEDLSDRRKGEGGGEEITHSSAQQQQQQRHSDRTSSIFDFTGSSPECIGKTTRTTNIEPQGEKQAEEKEETKASSSFRSTRRHSSVPSLEIGLFDHGSGNGSARGSLNISRRTRRESVV